jgi:DNA-binding HxlR family transcriptional regulator
MGAQPDSRRIYRQFCMMARALEIVGERWTLLIVRDLLLGPQRFTDLQRGLADITPTRLTTRLRQLETDGVVNRDRSSTGREVWYGLSGAGRKLEPIIDELTLWGIEHAFESPRPDERICPTPAMIGTKVVLRRNAPPLKKPVVWTWRFADDSYTIRGDTKGWTLVRGQETTADVIIETTPEAWARFLTTREERKLPSRDNQLTGKPAAIADLARAFAARNSKRRAG